MLRKKYKLGYAKTARSLQGEALNRKLIELVQNERDMGGRFVSSVAQHLPDFDQVSTNIPEEGESEDDDDDETSSTLEVDWQWEFDDNKWIFSGWVEPTDEPEGEWGVEISIPKKGEDGATTGYENVADVSSTTGGTIVTQQESPRDGRSDRVGIVRAEADVDGFEFECQSERLESLDPFSGHGGETTLGLTRSDPGGDD
ncbi:hypothetical protein [Halorhabdus sp. CBA1104]|uniref:hypothetical protein n=1 Tax=Halorhabdus sp. CBA1104 TaxID=1380432 RepID=UPI0012B2814A|nr:hypothetical protein [Halorhabdus sp. CBA1104]